MIAVIGAGHNGMVAALTLAKAGKEVVLFEKHSVVGGICRREAFADGFFTNGVTHHVGGWAPTVTRHLGLNIATRPPTSRYLPESNGPGLVLAYQPGEAEAELKERGIDARQYSEYRRFIRSIQPLVDGVLTTLPPSIQANRSLLDYLPHAFRFRRLGKQSMLEVLRIGAMSAQDWIGEISDDPLLQSALCSPACFSAWLGPRSPLGTANLLFEESLNGHELAGGAGALAEALALALDEEQKITVKTNISVDEILVENGSVCAVRTSEGSTHPVDAVLAACAPQKAILGLINAKHVPVDLARNTRNIRARGSVAVAHFGIKGDLRFAGRPDLQVEHALIGESPTIWERCFDDVKHRRISALPCLDVRVPSLGVDGLCPSEHHVVSVHAFGAPFDVEGGWTDETKQAFLNNIITSLERYAPEFRAQIVAQHLLSPTDLENDYALPGGHLLHAEIAVDQLWVTRPTPAIAQYETPIHGLFLGSMGMHPGAGVNGLSGLLAAKACLKR